jgi:NADH-quinone oxidoreductase subunit N
VNPVTPPGNWHEAFLVLLPELLLGLAACCLFLAATFRADRNLWALVSVLTLVLAGLVLVLDPMASRDYGIAVAALSLVADPLAYLIRLIALGGGIVLVLFSWNQLPDRQAAEYYACLLLIVAGLSLTGMANDLVTLFLALELISIPTYVFLYLPRHDSATQEAAVKYFLLSIFSSALLLFGFSYLYGLAGTTILVGTPDLPGILDSFISARREEVPALASVALVMIVAGLGFRITAVPFHFYAPDVFQGAHITGAAMLAFVPKVAGFVALLRVLGFVLPEVLLGKLRETELHPGLLLGGQVSSLMWILAAVTMSLGNLLALLQDNLKRLLAYSSVAHAGYMLLGLVVAPDLHAAGGAVGSGVEAVLFYLVAYGAMTLGAFAVLAYVSTLRRPVETVDDLAGLSVSQPGVALLMAIFLFSLIGIPLTAGFLGKFLLFFLLFSGALAVPEHSSLFLLLGFIGVLNAAIGAWYYLRIIAVMYLRTPIRPHEPERSRAGLATLWICAVVTVFFGVYPQPLLEMARKAAVVPTGARMPEARAQAQR